MGDSSDQPETLPGLPGLVVKERIHLSPAKVKELVAPLHKVVTSLREGQSLPIWLQSWIARTTDSFVFTVKYNGMPLDTHTAIPFDSHCTVEVGGHMFVIAPVRRGPIKHPTFRFTRRATEQVDKDLTKRMADCEPGKHPSNDEFFRLMAASAKLALAPEKKRSGKKRKAGE